MYLHCHNCSWSQDDFWTWHYNPITKLWDTVMWLGWPKVLELDDCCVRSLETHTGVRVHRLEGAPRGQVRVFSWFFLILEVIKEWKTIRKQRWWTWDSWERSREEAVCPQCGIRCFDVD